MDDDSSQYLAYQLEIENEYYELLNLEKFYQPFLEKNDDSRNYEKH